MTIDILDITQSIDNEGVVESQTAFFAIDSGGTTYHYIKGGLPPTATQSDIQTILDTEEVELAAAAVAKGEVLSAAQVSKLEARQFIDAHPNAKLLINLSLADLETAIENRSASEETLLLKALAVAVRYLYKASKLE